ncbi:NAD(P)-dependent oxidoreductase [Leptolyngbya sp. 7M]|uniref:NAD(P)-dependent oxidoreductase n=1 Tax=Leptolyngbya sp. 7M TaxID=2812896 RepID=UPI001B8D1231|nr:NAD(P)-dependent oxidoreductase [Leptolyngbya sp. 7M]QYO65316.1 NAD(P)-dependent oxidoreductase [Leptolyngbya sp. 7M]
MTKEFCTPLDVTQIERNFAEIEPLMTPAEALAEANRCLYCYDAPCTRACPTHIDVPSFIKKIASGNLTGSARVIFDANPIGSTCARVCPVEVLCEGSCVEKTLVQKPIEIGRLQRYATQHAIDNGKHIFERAEPTGKSVGIIGSGPAGLSCAAYLARLGYEVTVYERREKAGGLDTYGMAEYKMTQADSLAEVRYITSLGIDLKLGVSIIGDEHQTNSSEQGANGLSTKRFAQLQKAHDAIFLAIGLGRTRKLSIPGEDLDGVFDALSFIERVKTRNWDLIPVGKRTVVVGAGNTAIDAVTQAKRLGAARSILMYRRTEKDASAYDYEIELAKADGIEFHWQTTPVEIIGEGRVQAIRCTSPEGEKIIDCEMIIIAIGQDRQKSFLTDVAGIATDDQGRAVVSENMQTSKPNIFAGGDCVNGGAEAVDAAQMGKLAAIGIHQHLSGERIEFAGSAFPK